MHGGEQEKSPAAGKTPVLIYDAACPVCSGTIKWIERNEIPGSFEMLPCEAERVSVRFPNLPEEDCMKAMHLVLPDGSVLVGEQALPEIIARTRRFRPASLLFKLPGASFISHILYRWFADHRYRIAGFLFHSGRSRNEKQ